VPVGALFDPRSPESIAAAVRTVSADEAIYEQRRHEARRLALTRFNWSIEERRLLEMYEELRPRKATAETTGNVLR
jgi:glycosyltransferase involved in cell wall biosynthesis